VRTEPAGVQHDDEPLANDAEPLQRHLVTVPGDFEVLRCHSEALPNDAVLVQWDLKGVPGEPEPFAGESEALPHDSKALPQESEPLRNQPRALGNHDRGLQRRSRAVQGGGAGLRAPAGGLRLLDSRVGNRRQGLRRLPGRVLFERLPRRSESLGGALGAHTVGEILFGLDDQGRMERLQDALKALERQLRAAGEDAAQVAGVDASLLAEAVAGTVALLNEIGQVISVIGRRDFTLGDTEAGLQVLTDPVGYGLRGQARAPEFLGPPGGELRPLWLLTVAALHCGEEDTLLLVEATEIQPPAGDRLICLLLHQDLVSTV